MHTCSMLENDPRTEICTQDSVIVTSRGIERMEPGDLIEPGLLEGTEKPDAIHERRGYRPIKEDPNWRMGRPIEVLAEGKKRLISRAHRRDTWGDMDVVLPPDVRNRRVGLIRQRMKEERGR